MPQQSSPLVAILFSLVCLDCSGDIAGVEIKSMSVPRVVQSGAEDHVVLDCDYDLNEKEARQVDVKWFFNDDNQPFFQWIPGRKPQTIGDLFENKLDLTFKAREGTDEWYKEHRSIKIIRPTAELSGTYRCKVSSFVDEDVMQREMLVFGRAKTKKNDFNG